jgi:hypothetical protein
MLLSKTNEWGVSAGFVDSIVAFVSCAATIHLPVNHINQL